MAQMVLARRMVERLVSGEDLPWFSLTAKPSMGQPIPKYTG